MGEIKAALRIVARAVLLAASVAALQATAAACSGLSCPAKIGHSSANTFSASSATPISESSTSIPSILGKLIPNEKRQAVYMTATDKEGNAYSFMGGDEVPSMKLPLVLLAMLSGVLAFIILKPQNSPAKAVSETNGFPTLDLPGTTAHFTPESSPTGNLDQLPPIDDFELIAEEPLIPTWSDLVNACSGDPIRAATIISGEMAVDPTLKADSPVAIARALARVRPS